VRYAITHIPTGETRIYEDDERDYYDYEWMWTEGNYGYDCNRFLFFERAGGNDPSLDECPPCGVELYSVEFLEYADKLAPARGCLIGAFCGSVLWGIALVVYLVLAN